MLADTVFRRRK